MPRVSSLRETEDDVGSLPAMEKRQIVQRVIDSEMFRRSSALRAFLLYITNHEIAGQADKLKEHTIGVEALGRKPDYVPMSDNIVRVRAHELRGRLERYFASEGANESVVITIPVGSYVPKFVPRRSLAIEAPAPVPVPVIASPPRASGEERWWRRNWLPFAAVVLLSSLVSIVAVRYASRGEGATVTAQSAPAIHDFWAQFFEEPHEELHVIYSDPGFALWQDLNGQSLNLGDYLNEKYLSNHDKLLQVAVRRVASTADIAIAAHLGTITGQFDGQINPQLARDINPKVLQHGNVVLTGSRRSNPWVELYEPSLNFTLGQDPQSGAPLFRNRSPRPGEAAEYAMPTIFDRPGSGIAETEYKSYGVIALLKGCGNRGLTVVVEGLNRQATLAAGDMLTDPQRLSSLLQTLGHKPGTNVAPFEALVQVTSLPNDYSDPKVIAFRQRSATACVGE